MYIKIIQATLHFLVLSIMYTFQRKKQKKNLTPYKLKQQFILSLFPIMILISCNQSIEKTNPSIEKISESVYASGIIKSRNQYQVYSMVTGLIDSIFIAEGDFVNKNDVIIRISNVSAKLNAENAKLAAELASFNANGDKLNELKVSIDIAKKKLVNDSIQWMRQKNLWAQQIGTLNELEQRELNYKNALSNFQSAVLRYQDTKKQFDILVKQAKNNLQISTSTENDFLIRSQTKGRVYNILKEKGEMVNPLNPIAVIGDASDFILELQIDEYDITKLKRDQLVFINMDSYKGNVYEGRIQKINPIMNERTRSFTVEASFTEKPPNLYPHLTVEANILIQTKENALTIPRNYLLDDSLVLKKNNEKVKVSIGLKDFKKVEILGGLNATDLIYKPGK